MNSKPKIVVMIPAYNEEKTIGLVIRGVKKAVPNAEVLVIDDGSTDNTSREAGKAKADRIERHEENKGLGIAFKTGIESALEMKADIIVNIDADLQFNPEDIPKLVEPILKGKADVVTCSRFLDKRIEPKMPFVKRFGNSVFTWLISFLTKKKFTDTQCGFRAYSRESALRMNLFGKFTYTQEVLLDLAEKGFRIEEVACKVKGEREGKSRVVQNWHSYGIKASMIIIRAIRDYKPLRFFGGIGLTFMVVGFLSALALWVRLLLLHRINPYMWVAYADAVLLIIGFLLIMLALVADMLGRQRKIQEEIIYRIKKQQFDKEA